MTLGNVHPSIEPFATYRARDGQLMICAGNDRQFAACVGALGIPETADDPSFATNGARVGIATHSGRGSRARSRVTTAPAGRSG